MRRAMILAAAGWLMLPGRGFATATLEVTGLPTAVIADGESSLAVLVRITNGYPNNIYAVKGTFSGGDLPYFGLTYNEARTAWISQMGAWDTLQPRIRTDAAGKWEGWLYLRLEAAGPRGDSLFRFSAIPQDPISNPGPTVSPWTGIRALTAVPGGGAGRLEGHVYVDAACTTPADGVVVRAWSGADYTGSLVGQWLSQNTRVADGTDHSDTGRFSLACATGVIRSISARDRGTRQYLPVYTRIPPPWTVKAGEVTSVDRLWGDVDGSGKCDLADVLAAARLASGVTPSASAARHAADVWPSPPDGLVTLEDVLRLHRAVSH